VIFGSKVQKFHFLKMKIGLHEMGLKINPKKFKKINFWGILHSYFNEDGRV
jgi:hypothetical protein